MEPTNTDGTPLAALSLDATPDTAPADPRAEYEAKRALAIAAHRLVAAKRRGMMVLADEADGGPRMVLTDHASPSGSVGFSFSGKIHLTVDTPEGPRTLAYQASVNLTAAGTVSWETKQGRPAKK